MEFRWLKIRNYPAGTRMMKFDDVPYTYYTVDAVMSPHDIYEIKLRYRFMSNKLTRMRENLAKMNKNSPDYPKMANMVFGVEGEFEEMRSLFGKDYSTLIKPGKEKIDAFVILTEWALQYDKETKKPVEDPTTGQRVFAPIQQHKIPYKEFLTNYYR